MTRDNIIRMAKEAGFYNGEIERAEDAFVRFVALVADAEAKRIHNEGMVKLAIAKEALEKLAKLGNGDRYGNSIGNSIAMEALDKMAENAKELGLSYEQPAPPECKTEAEKTAYAFGWYKALESVREQPAPAQDPYCYTYTENGEEFFAPPTAYVPENAIALYTTPPAPAPVPEAHKPLTMVEMVDAAMVATRTIYPPITRSQCETIIRAAAHGITGEKNG